MAAASPAARPLNANAATFTASTLTPDSSAASWLPPTAKMCRPSTVRLSRTMATSVNITNTSTAMYTPPIRPWPRTVNEGAETEIRKPPVISSASPP